MQSKHMVIGITGGIGSGKSAVSSIIKTLGYPVIDADEISRHVLNQGTEAYDKTVNYFGAEILLETGDVNRALLGEIIFNDISKREKLNTIVHPAVYNTIYQKINQLKESYPVIFVDVPLLYENKREADYDEVWVVNASDSIRIKRICERDQVDEAYALVKMKAQMPLAEKVIHATRIINNEGSLDMLERAVTVLLNTIKK